jgi:hypothetical protein
VAYCNPQQVAVYAFQDIVPLKRGRALEVLSREVLHTDFGSDLTADRLTYDFRLIEIHKLRYEQHCQRGDWLGVELGLVLLAIRDILLVLSGVWEYNVNDRSLWSRLATMELESSTADLMAAVEDIKQLDDRVAFAEKLDRLDSVVETLRDLCRRRSLPIGSLYADDVLRERLGPA